MHTEIDYILAIENLKTIKKMYFKRLTLPVYIYRPNQLGVSK
jgi:hypothetical protein